MERLTIECKHPSTRVGIVVEVEGSFGPRSVRAILQRAFDVAGSESVRRVGDPGWWALVVGRAAMEFGPARVQRVVDVAALHATVEVQSSRMVEVRPAWPMVQLKLDGPWLDVRGESALACGPSDDELLAYAERVGADGLGLESLVRMFDMGVIEWASGEPAAGKRRALVPAGA